MQCIQRRKSASSESRVSCVRAGLFSGHADRALYLRHVLVPNLIPNLDARARAKPGCVPVAHVSESKKKSNAAVVSLFTPTCHVAG